MMIKQLQLIDHQEKHFGVQDQKKNISTQQQSTTLNETN